MATPQHTVPPSWCAADEWHARVQLAATFVSVDPPCRTHQPIHKM
ncbi:hypothetical protein [Mycetohabitans endofungorum]|nr:hypothetical protein [Mycetohabitans endofungorum]